MREGVITTVRLISSDLWTYCDYGNDLLKD